MNDESGPSWSKTEGAVHTRDKGLRVPGPLRVGTRAWPCRTEPWLPDWRRKRAQELWACAFS